MLIYDDCLCLVGGCCGCNKKNDKDDGSDSGSGSESDNDMMEWLEEMQHKRNHPNRLHPDLWYNEEGQVSV